MSVIKFQWPYNTNVLLGAGRDNQHRMLGVFSDFSVKSSDGHGYISLHVTKSSYCNNLLARDHGIDFRRQADERHDYWRHQPRKIEIGFYIPCTGTKQVRCMFTPCKSEFTHMIKKWLFATWEIWEIKAQFNLYDRVILYYFRKIILMPKLG